MLVLSRKQGERITIGDNIEIVISEVSGGRVRIGINAPREVSIRRSELSEFIEGEVRRHGELAFT